MTAATAFQPTAQTVAQVAERGYALPMPVDADLIQISAVSAQFLRTGDIIERKGVVIELTSAERFDQIGVVGFSYYNELGGICGGQVPFDVEVPLFDRV